MNVYSVSVTAYVGGMFEGQRRIASATCGSIERAKRFAEEAIAKEDRPRGFRWLDTWRNYVGEDKRVAYGEDESDGYGLSAAVVAIEVLE